MQVVTKFFLVLSFQNSLNDMQQEYLLVKKTTNQAIDLASC